MTNLIQHVDLSMDVSTHSEEILTNTKLKIMRRPIRPCVEALWTKLDKIHIYDLCNDFLMTHNDLCMTNE